MRGLRLGFGMQFDGAGEAPAPAPAVITIVSVSTQESDGDVPVSYTIDKNDATVEAVVFAAAEPNPAAADFGGANATYVDQGTVSLTTSGSPINLNITGTFNGSVKLALLPTGGGDSDVVVSSAFTLDTTAPTISTLSPADNATSVAVDANLVITFSEAMKQQGTVDLRVVGGSLIESFDLATEGTWSVGDTVWTGNPASDFTNGASLCVRWSGLEDTKGNALADNTGDTQWNFGVVSSASVTMASTRVSTTAQNTTVSVPTNVAGDVIGVWVNHSGGLTGVTGYTLRSAASGLQYFDKVSTGGETTASITGSASGNIRAIAAVFSGVDTAVVAVSATGAQTGTTPLNYRTVSGLAAGAVSATAACHSNFSTGTWGWNQTTAYGAPGDNFFAWAFDNQSGTSTQITQNAPSGTSGPSVGLCTVGYDPA